MLSSTPSPTLVVSHVYACWQVACVEISWLLSCYSLRRVPTICSSLLRAFQCISGNIVDAQEHPSYGNWAGGIVKQYSRLGMASPFSSSGITGLNSLGFQANMKGQLCRVWDGLHVSPRTAPSKRAKLCTYFAWFLRPSQLKSVPYFELPMPISRVQLLMQFRMGSHALPVEQGRLAKPAVPRHLRRCTLCRTRALGDDWGILFLTAPILPTFVASFGRYIRMLMVPCSVLCGTRTRKLFAIAWRSCSNWLMTPTKTRPHQPMLAEWTSEILSLSLSATDCPLLSGRHPAFDRASENLGAAPCGHTASRGPAPAACLKVPQMCKNAGGCPLPSFSRQGRHAQPPGDPEGLSNPGDT